MSISKGIKQRRILLMIIITLFLITAFAVTALAYGHYVPWPQGSKLEALNIASNSLTLTWSQAVDSSKGITGYKIYQDGEEIDAVDGNTHYYDVTGLLPSTEYTFKVEAGNTEGKWSTKGPSLTVTTTGGGQLSIVDIYPPSYEKSSDDSNVYFEVKDLVDPDNVYFCWNFSNGLHKKIIANLGKISLTKKDDGSLVDLDRGNLTQEEVDSTFSEVITLGDFKYTKLQSPKLRQLEFNLKSTQLEPFTTYVLKIKPDFEANNDGKLGKAYYWEFTTNDPNDQTPPSWSENSELKTDATPTSVTLEWTEAEDNVYVSGYKIYQGDEELAEVDQRITTYCVEGLTPATEYTFTVEAFDGNGNQSSDGPSATVKTAPVDTESPTWPQDTELKITNAAAPALILHWTPAEDNWGVTAYRIYQDEKLLDTVDGESLKYHVTGLEVNKPYRFTVEAGDAFDNWSINNPNIDVVLDKEDTTPPKWPRDSGATVSYVPGVVECRVNLTWVEATDNIGVVAYRIYQNDEVIATVDENTFRYNLVLPVDNQCYTYQVEAVDAAGNATKSWSRLPVYTGDPEADRKAPTWPKDTMVKAYDITDTTLTLEWTPAEDENGIVGYCILMDGYYIDSLGASTEDEYRSFSNRTYKLDPSNPHLGPFKGMLQPGTEHKFKIRAFDGAFNESGNSPEIRVTLGGSPTMGVHPQWKWELLTPELYNVSVDNINGVYNKVYDPIDPANVEFCWSFDTGLKDATDPMYMENICLRKADGEEVELSQQNIEVISTNSPKVRQVKLILKNTDIVLEDLTTYILELKPGFTVRNSSSWGYLDRSFIWEFTTAVADAKAPTWPEGSEVKITNFTPTSITVNWSAAEDNVAVTRYEIYQVKEGNDELVGTVDGQTTSYEITGLEPNGSYTFKIRAGDYNGNWSDKLEVTGTTASPDVLAPTWPEGSILNSTDVAAATLTLNWSKADDDWGVTSYKIYKDEELIATLDGSITTYNVTGLMPTTEYTFKVEAGDAFDNWSTSGPVHKVATAKDTTAPTWPDGSTLKRTAVTDSSVTLSWTEAVDDVAVTAYKIYCNGEGTGTVQGSTTYEVTGLDPNTQYSFKVEAVDAAENQSSGGPSLIQWTTPAESIQPKDNHFAVGYRHNLYLHDGTLWAWGNNQYSMLGDGTQSHRSTPIKIEGISGIKSIAAGLHHTLFLKDDGTVWACGSNRFGQLGNGEAGLNTETKRYYTSTVPVQVKDLTDVIAVAAGDFHSMALKSDGTVWTWGSNRNGTLGIGTQEDSYTGADAYSSVPVKVEGLEGVIAFAGGKNHSLALRNDKTVYGWGANYWGSLGTGTPAVYTTPTEIPGLTGVVAISACCYNTLFLKHDGTVWACGENRFGQLGDGTNQSRFAPVLVKGLTGVKAVSVGRNHSMALKNDGTVWAWGCNYNGRLGDGTNTIRSTPVSVVGLTDVDEIAAGEFHSTAIVNGSVLAWGWNMDGQLGYGEVMEEHYLPGRVPIEGSSEWKPAPELTKAEVTNKGDVSLTFNKPMAEPAEGAEVQFKVTVDGVDIAVTSVVSTNTSEKIKLELETKIIGGQKVAVTYAQDDNENLWLKDSGDGIVEGFDSIEVINGLSVILDPPALTVDPDNNILGQSVDITFIDDSAWRGAINSIQVNGVALDKGYYTISKGKINIDASVFTEAGDYAIVVVAEGYTDAIVTQTIKPAVTEPESPILEVAELTTDRNISLNFNKEIAEPKEGAESQFIVTVNGVNVEVTEVIKVKQPGKIKLILATPIGEGQEVTVAYTKSTTDDSLLIRAADGSSVESFGSITIPYALLDAPTLSADIDNNTVGQEADINITFTDNSAWRGAINSIQVNGAVLDVNQYTISEGKINIDASVFDKAGEYTILINADGYKDASVIQTIKSDTTEPEPPAEVETDIVVEITTDRNVSLNFIREDEQGELMTIVVPEGKSKDPQFVAQFTVMVDGKEVKVVEVKKVRRPGKIKLILASPIEEGQEVTVKYVKGDDEDLWLKFTNEEIVADFDFTQASEKEKEPEEPKPEQTIQPDPTKDVDAEIPSKTDKGSDAKLPRTGGAPVELFYGFGALLMASGIALRFRKKKAA